MKSFLRIARDTLVIAFCLWHIAAVGITALPAKDTSQISNWVRATLVPIVNPYILLTSQWQQWSMFSQETLNRIILHRVEAKTGTGWTTLASINFHAMPWYKNEQENGILFSVTGVDKWPLRQLYLEWFCRQRKIPSGTEVRMAYDYYDIPSVTRDIPYQWWVNWNPPWVHSQDTQTTFCPAHS